MAAVGFDPSPDKDGAWAMPQHGVGSGAPPNLLAPTGTSPVSATLDCNAIEGLAKASDIRWSVTLTPVDPSDALSPDVFEEALPWSCALHGKMPVRGPHSGRPALM